MTEIEEVTPCMDRSLGSEAFVNHIEDVSKVSVIQSRKGWCRGLIGCFDVSNRFHWYKKKEGEGRHGREKFAISKEESSCCLRNCCPLLRPYTMVLKDEETGDELITMRRHFSMCAPAPCKCCCHQSMSISSGGQELGKIRERPFLFVPRFKIYDDTGKAVYKVHQPTCCGGCCVHCCSDGNPCGKGFCKVGFHVFPDYQKVTDGNIVSPAGKILRRPRGFVSGILSDADQFDIDFPLNASNEEKALLMGTAIYLNSVFFETRELEKDDDNNKKTPKNT